MTSKRFCFEILSTLAPYIAPLDFIFTYKPGFTSFFILPKYQNRLKNVFLFRRDISSSYIGYIPVSTYAVKILLFIFLVQFSVSTGWFWFHRQFHRSLSSVSKIHAFTKGTHNIYIQ